MKRQSFPKVAGVDGCKFGWIVCHRVDGQIEFTAKRSFAEIFEIGLFDRVVVDMPIGFADEARKGGRDCEREARRILAPAGRASCVFNSPCREALCAKSPEDAQSLNKRAAGLKLSKQSLNLFKKMREVDKYVRRGNPARAIVESHPEIAFAAMNGGPLAEGKKKKAGRIRRLELLKDKLMVVRESSLEKYLRKEVALDDYIDAAAMLWVAERLALGTAKPIPERPPKDRYGIEMAIWR